jgi:diguanylate cyclase (GGDEF)-like protein
MSQQDATIAVHKDVHVKATPEEAFALFTRKMRCWFSNRVVAGRPVSEFVLQPQIGGVWLERTKDGREFRWGDVLAWDPPSRLVLAWRINPQWKYDADLLTQVEVRFRANESGTAVQLEHRLDGYGSAASHMLETLELNWQTLLERFVSYAQRVSRRYTVKDTQLSLIAASAAPSDAPQPPAVDPPNTIPEGASELKQLLREALRHLAASSGALIVPDKNIALVRWDGDGKQHARFLRRLHRRLLRISQTHRGPVIINEISRTDGQHAGPYRILSCAVRSREGRALGVLSLLRDSHNQEFTERDAHLAQLLAYKASGAIESNYDSLSGLYTWPAFERGAQAVLVEATTRPHWSALHIDIDRLHVINDKFGRYAGDSVLRQFGEYVRQQLPANALGARMSGDRFAVLIPETLLAAEAFAETLRSGAERLARADGEARPPISISVGVAPLEQPSGTLAHALSAAETACKAAKDRGRNRVEIYQAADVSIVRRFADIGIAAQVHEAIDTGRLHLHAQRIHPLSAREPLHPHMELLLRMQDAKGCLIGPERFLSAAVRYQMMPVIDRWVINHAVKLLSACTALRDQRLSFSINFSGQSLNDAPFTEFLFDRIGSSGLDPGLFCFELTENATVANLTRAAALMSRLRQLGCGVALDDFGTGFSSLSCLRQLPVTMLKIDGSFVRDVRDDPRAASMIRAIAQLARGMSIATVAEYAETEEILEAVRELGVDYAQGFAIHRPQDLSELLQELNSQHQQPAETRQRAVGVT